MEIPENGFWHCKIHLKVSKSSWPILQKDMCFDDIYKQIVKPYRKNKEFLVGGTRIENRGDIKQIKIYYTDNKFDTYGRRLMYNNSAYVDSITPPDYIAYEKGTDFTQYLLYSEEFDQEFVEIQSKELSSNPAVSINNNNTNHNTQSVVVNISVHFNQIEALQESFDNLRQELHSLNLADEKRLKETQDALDALSPQSSPEQATSALTKVKRVLKNITDTTTSLGQALASTTVAVENLGRLKDVYNATAPAFGLSPL